MNFFGAKQAKQEDPQELAKTWKRQLAKEIRSIDRDLEKLKRAEAASMAECKKLIKQGYVPASKVLAKEVVNTRRAASRMYAAKAQLNSVSMGLQTSAAMIKVQGCIAKSADIMGAMNKLVNIPEISATMATMAREMEKAGLVDSIIGDAMDSMDSEGIDAEADLEVDRIVTEITAGILAPAASAPESKIKRAAVAAPAAAAPAAASEEEEPASDELREMQARLAAL